MLRIINFRVDVKTKDPLEALLVHKFPVLKGQIEQIHVVRRAVDARKKPHITFVYTLFVAVRDEGHIMKRLGRDKNVSTMEPIEPETIVHGEQRLVHRPVVVGFGPAGMLAAFYLAREGYRPIVLERGQDVDQRAKDVEEFWSTGHFKPESNVQFGEGGAGTFSDGKLTTRVTHPRLHEIAKYFVQFGAPEEILYKHKPHVGTDVLRGMVKAMREQIIAWGGDVRFGAKVTNLILEKSQVTGVVVNDTETISTNLVFAGIGHSARDTYEMMYHAGIPMESKPFAVGVRIEHPQAMIDISQYGIEPAELGLGAAEYSVVYHDKETGRTAYSFCMCPGGEVVASASETGHVVTNGMSLYARASGVANSALVVTVGPDDFGTHPLGGVAFQREWEAKAYELGGRDYKAPLQTVGDFLAHQVGTVPVGQPEAPHSYRPGVVAADLHECLPTYVTDVMERALPYFGRRIKGFDEPQICMTGVETRTSSPLRILRDDDRESPTIKGLYPMGEGAGYAGGIMSAALDGAETAIRVMVAYKPLTAQEGEA
ncbi:NAD(P)/FAD-dependent oxidoreductase [Veillonella criceti]|uniref:Uncharacterized conserved protein n=1 Tax=Veillonella criceti TaxID=103891 RepID=A0A380NMG8_9FIRM|nr:hypothetical protein [Veillonella criceti]SUP43473.1 Uncharacterized conserved protein [Veillonella criceti]